jgi:hypothetical protein
MSAFHASLVRGDALVCCLQRDQMLARIGPTDAYPWIARRRSVAVQQQLTPDIFRDGEQIGFVGDHVVLGQ